MRVIAALFDILGKRVIGALLLDLSAGTGGVGIEALSRGARRAVFVERSRRVIRATGLAEDGLAIAQIYPKEDEDLELKTLRLIEQRRYGSTMLCFYGVSGEDK